MVRFCCWLVKPKEQVLIFSLTIFSDIQCHINEKSVVDGKGDIDANVGLKNAVQLYNKVAPNYGR